MINLTLYLYYKQNLTPKTKKIFFNSDKCLEGDIMNANQKKKLIRKYLQFFFFFDFPSVVTEPD